MTSSHTAAFDGHEVFIRISYGRNLKLEGFDVTDADETALSCDVVIQDVDAAKTETAAIRFSHLCRQSALRG